MRYSEKQFGERETWNARGSKFNIVLRKASDGSMQLIRQPTRPLPAELQQVVEENK